MHKDILAQLFKTDKFVQNSEKKSKTKELDLKEDFAVVKNKQNFDVAIIDLRTSTLFSI